MKILLGYVPVLHKGYIQFIQKHLDAVSLQIFGTELIAEFPWLSKEIRQLEPEDAQKAIEALSLLNEVSIARPESLSVLNQEDVHVVMPNEDISRLVAEKYLPHAHVSYDPIFLRWDKHNSIAEKPAVPDDQISRKDFDRMMIALAEKESTKSADIWRHVGAVIVKEGEALLSSYNSHVPSDHTPYINGDPRNNFHKGEYIEISSALHAEASIISQAAKEGISLLGTDMYLTVFPCPPCAKLIANAGIKNLYCGGGYAVLDGAEVLKANNVRIIFVE